MVYVQAPQEVHKLVEKFDSHIEQYKSGSYKEHQVRVDFVDPFFAALGWDIHNDEGADESYRDVRHEYSIKTAEGTKSPDYCFRIGGIPKFFLETKKPSVHIKDDVGPAFQIRRYALSKSLPLSLLTDFEEFAVYDCRLRPQQDDKASKGRVLYYTYKEYLEKWEEIYSRFSREAVGSGAFDKYIEKDLPKKGTSSFDKFFLEDMEKWRDSLARNIAPRNEELSQKELNHLVQATIDRILFLRICEDREIEPYGGLQKLIANDGIYSGLTKLFQQADDKYNSGLFHFKQEKGRNNPDTLSLNLSIDDKPLKDIIKVLYYPESPYVYSQIPVEILGQVYEKFLGKVIRLTPSHRAKVELKPEVRKAGGVYYTPKYIVDYIVKNTVGELLKKKTPTQAKKLTILDPACGSGSFLLGAYQHLLDWYLEQYSKEPSKYKKQIYKGARDQWFLASQEKKNILVSNIYGVDIDRQAVEVSKLSLLLKVLEGESNDTIQSQRQLFHERALPDLSDNIKCGNSLIGTDFFHGKNLDMFARDDMEAINAFDWDGKDGFAEIMKSGGFDAVIGNPPWGAEFSESVKLYLADHYSELPRKIKDSYLYFFLNAFKTLLKMEGFFSFIIPNTWLLINNAEKFRKFILTFQINNINDYGDGVFEKVTVESSVIVMCKKLKNSIKCYLERWHKNKLVINKSIDTSIWLKDDLARIVLEQDVNKIKILEKIKNYTEPFSASCEIIWGIKPYQEGYGDPPQTRDMINNRVYHSQTQVNKYYKPLLVGSHIEKYSINFKKPIGYIKYGRWLMYPSNKIKMSNPKLLLRQTSFDIKSVYDEKGYFCQNSVFIITSFKYNLKFLLGLLNSKFLGFLYFMKNPQQGKVFPEIKPIVIKSLPIRIIETNNKQHDHMVKLVDQMLDTQKELHASIVRAGQEALPAKGGYTGQADRRSGV